MDQAVMTKWEYLVQEAHGLEALRAELQRLGTDGWELIDIVRGQGGESPGPVKTLRMRRDDTFCLVLKRPAE